MQIISVVSKFKHITETANLPAFCNAYKGVYGRFHGIRGGIVAVLYNQSAVFFHKILSPTGDLVSAQIFANPSRVKAKPCGNGVSGHCVHNIVIAHGRYNTVKIAVFFIAYNKCGTSALLLDIFCHNIGILIFDCKIYDIFRLFRSCGR